ncbi:hypothetical protein DLJ53_24820 [Acuticoccus sediminis]|uniref:Solute-binding protein family 5 domain-containing protein n=1 Tax=Acuticoccus sediminis TaxID=2184697 RepID=A0A8B2NPK2_9HYPH|nr:ABC transporter substrate-binding protein [Acuticoccus sediminis]RAH98860.1 hypothetical protein DLJ53_24820 [Acuticoccus sediminis]
MIPLKAIKAPLTVAAIALSLAAIDRAEAAEGSIYVAQSVDPATLDPMQNIAAQSLNVFQNVFEQLTRIGTDGSLEPLLAESWDVNDDATVWTFKLNTGSTFHNGEPVTADDIIYTYETIINNPGAPAAGYLKAVDKVEKIDDTTIRFTLNQPYAIFGRQVSLIFIVPKKAYEEMGPEAFSTKPIGSGPFKVEEWVKDDHITLTANEDYWKGAPKVAEVQFIPMPSEPARAAALASGEIDIVPLLPPPLVDSLSSQSGIKIDKVESNRVVFAGYVPDDGPLGNEKIRKAIDYSIDRKAITERLLRGLGNPIGQIAPPVTFGYDPSVEPTPYDPEKAKALLAEAGYDGTPIKYMFPTNRWAFATQSAQAIAGYMQQAGINVEMEPMDYAAYLPMWINNTLEGMYMFSLGISILDADLILGLEYESEKSHGYWFSDELDALAKEQRATADQEKRQAAISKIWQISNEKALFSPIYVEVQAYGVRDCVTAWEPRADERLNFAEAAATCEH